MGEPQWIDQVLAQGAASEHRASDAPVTALLFCAEEDAATLVQLGSAMVSAGLLPRIVPGVELDVRVLGQALDMMVGPTLATIIVSDHLDRHQAHRLAQTFTQARNRLHRLLVLELEPRRPRSMLRALRRAGESLQRTLRLDEDSRAELTTGATVADVAAGEHQVPLSAVETVSLRVYQAPVIVGSPLRDEVGIIPSHVRVPASIQRSRPLRPSAAPRYESSAATRPDMRITADDGPAVPFPEAVESSESLWAATGPPLQRRPVSRPWLAVLAIAVATVSITGFGVAVVVPVARTVPGLPSVTEWAAGAGSSDPDVSEPLELESAVPEVVGGAVAQARCESLAEPEGRRWRLPTTDELGELMATQRIAVGSYWSQGAPEEAVARWRPDGRVLPGGSPDGQQKAGSVCVRGRPVED